MTTPAQAKRTVIFFMVVTVVVATARQIKNRRGADEKFSPRPLLGGALASIVLLAMTDRAPKIASGLSIMMAITAVTVAGPETIGSLSTESIAGFVSKVERKPTLQPESYTPTNPSQQLGPDPYIPPTSNQKPRPASPGGYY